MAKPASLTADLAMREKRNMLDVPKGLGEHGKCRVVLKTAYATVRSSRKKDSESKL